MRIPQSIGLSCRIWSIVCEGECKQLSRDVVRYLVLLASAFILDALQMNKDKTTVHEDSFGLSIDPHSTIISTFLTKTSFEDGGLSRHK